MKAFVKLANSDWLWEVNGSNIAGCLCSNLSCLTRLQPGSLCIFRKGINNIYAFRNKSVFIYSTFFKVLDICFYNDLHETSYAWVWQKN